jgi:hypothetical protein
LRNWSEAWERRDLIERRRRGLLCVIVAKCRLIERIFRGRKKLNDTKRRLIEGIFRRRMGDSEIRQD